MEAGKGPRDGEGQGPEAEGMDLIVLKEWENNESLGLHSTLEVNIRNILCFFIQLFELSQ